MSEESKNEKTNELTKNKFELSNEESEEEEGQRFKVGTNEATKDKPELSNEKSEEGEGQVGTNEPTKDKPELSNEKSEEGEGQVGTNEPTKDKPELSNEKSEEGEGQVGTNEPTKDKPELSNEKSEEGEGQVGTNEPTKDKPELSNEKSEEGVVGEKLAAARAHFHEVLRQEVLKREAYLAQFQPRRSKRNRRQKRKCCESSDDGEDQVVPVAKPKPSEDNLEICGRTIDMCKVSKNPTLYNLFKAWIHDESNGDYKEAGVLDKSVQKEKENTTPEEELVLPGPEGPVVTRIPELIEEQVAVDIGQIDLNYEQEEKLPTKEELMSTNLRRWVKVRRAWKQQARLANQRYAASLQALEINFKGT